MLVWSLLSGPVALGRCANHLGHSALSLHTWARFRKGQAKAVVPRTLSARPAGKATGHGGQHACGHTHSEASRHAQAPWRHTMARGLQPLPAAGSEDRLALSSPLRWGCGLHQQTAQEAHPALHCPSDLSRLTAQAVGSVRKSVMPRATTSASLGKAPTWHRGRSLHGSFGCAVMVPGRAHSACWAPSLEGGRTPH